MMAEYVHEKAERALAELTVGATDDMIISSLTAYLLAGKAGFNGFTLSLNHNGKASPCPLKVDRAGVKLCSVTLYNPMRARAWIDEALRRGYEVTCPTHKGQETRSLAAERDHIRHRAAMAAWRAKRAAGDDDAEIPF